MLFGAIAALIVGGLALGFAAAQTAPSIQISPSSVAPGQTTTVYGSGFCGAAGCSEVTITLDGQELAAVAVKPGGTFQHALIAPQIPDQYTVEAVQTASTGVDLKASYGLLVLPADLPPGATPTLPQPGVTQSPPPTVPAATPVGPTASPSPTPSPTASAPTPTGTTSAPEDARSDDDSSTVCWLAAGGGVLGALALIAGIYLLRKRRSG